jgi:lactoylglutathione lyase
LFGRKRENICNPSTQYLFESGARLEIMQLDSVKESKNKPGENYFGITHLAFSIGSKEMVDKLTQKLSGDGYNVLV